jgi:hypothetical protein
MHWSEIKNTTGLEGGYADISEDALANVPGHPEADVNRFYRGRISRVRWRPKGPVLEVTGLKQFDAVASAWRSLSERKRFTVDLREPNALDPVLLENGHVEILTLNSYSVVIYPPKTSVPSKPSRTTVSVKDLLKVAGVV